VVQILKPAEKRTPKYGIGGGKTYPDYVSEPKLTSIIVPCAYSHSPKEAEEEGWKRRIDDAFKCKRLNTATIMT
jgi:hypothetical protein